MANPADWFKETPIGAPGHVALTVNNDSEDKTFEELKTKIAAQVGRNILETTKSKATGIFNLYANVDLIRPYFNVETNDVAKRLAWSLIPRTTSELTGETVDLYGPVMILLTLVAVMLLGMKLSNTAVQEGTLLGTSLVICSTYWILSSLTFYFLGYLFTISITFLGFLSIFGYAMFGTCLSLLLHCFFVHTWIDHAGIFVFGGASSLALGVLLFAHTHNKKNGTVIGIMASAVHFLFLLYLKIFYASIYSAISEIGF
eukprot:TRINITY_DN3525_c0_g1_i1.p1 TRINITY_DN3525_c0_g1~~TRINITY_DN3525_c0_g1_i1.p1  ORF type:complete len:258 (+),score=54.41 TRINITY_DN3525_c0_g1_i1:187-960(+)